MCRVGLGVCDPGSYVNFQNPRLPRSYLRGFGGIFETASGILAKDMLTVVD